MTAVEEDSIPNWFGGSLPCRISDDEQNSLRRGNAGSYWGDDPHAPQRQLTQGSLDYVTQDFLAEITMSILQKRRTRNARLGYATDFLDQVRVLPAYSPRNRHQDHQ